MKKILFFVLFFVAFISLKAQMEYDMIANDHLATSSINAIYLKGGYGLLKKNGATHIVFHLLKGKKYVIKLQGNNVRFSFNGNGKSIIAISGDINELIITPDKNMDFISTITIAGKHKRGSYNYTLSYIYAEK